MGLDCRIERARRLGARLRRAAAARRRDAAHLYRHDRERERRARLDRAQRRRWTRLRLRDDFVHHVVLRAALAAHQHHRLHPASRRRTVGHAQSAPARICGPYPALLRGAARDHQRHSRSRLDRHRLARAASRRWSTSGQRSKPRCGDSRTAWPMRRSIVDIDAPATISARSWPTGNASGRSCSTCSPTRSASRSPARRITLAARSGRGEVVFKVNDRGPRHPARRHRHAFSTVREPHGGHAASRRWPRPVDRAILRRASRRQGPDRLGAGGGHDGDLHLPEIGEP